jgi:hypothetical protein
MRSAISLMLVVPASTACGTGAPAAAAPAGITFAVAP